VAPLAGAGLFSLLGGGSVAVIDALTFAFAASCLLRLRISEPRPAPREHHFLRELWAGAEHVGRTPALRRVIGATAVSLLVVGFSETVVFAVVGDGLHRDPSFLGVLLALQGIGAIAGGLTAASLLRRLGDVRTCGLGIAFFAVGDGLWLIQSLGPVAFGIVL